jgi:F-type H+-transporting ATPase subunit delta
VISVTLARRYARALLQVAQKQKETDRTHAELRELAALFTRTPTARKFFESPSIAHAEKLAFLASHKSQLVRPVYALLHVLLKRRRLDHLVAIAAEFEKLAERAQGVTRATVRTAVPLDDRHADVLTKALERRTGDRVLLTREIEPALLGGVVVSLDHKVIDGSLATELWRIRQRLLQTRVHGRG